MDEMNPMNLIYLILPLMDNPEDFLCILLRKWLQRIQTVPKLRQAHGHHGYTSEIWQISGQITDASFQLFPVIHALAEYNLPVHLNSSLIQDIHFLQGIACKTVMQHLTAQFGIGCME